MLIAISQRLDAGGVFTTGVGVGVTDVGTAVTVGAGLGEGAIGVAAACFSVSIGRAVSSRYAVTHAKGAFQLIATSLVENEPYSSK